MFKLGCTQIPEERPYIKNADFDKKISRTISFSVPTISPDELKEMGTSILLLDTRKEEEYNISHIPNAEYIGYKNFDATKLKDIPKDRPIVLYCSIGYRSEKIGEKLQKMGFAKVYNLYGSIFEWVNQGNSVVDKDGNATKLVHTYNKNWSKWVNEATIEKVW